MKQDPLPTVLVKEISPPSTRARRRQMVRPRPAPPCSRASELSTWPKYKGHVDGDYVQLLYLTSPLHDIGKVAIPDSILLKPGRLTADEFEVMKRHTLFGSDTLGSVSQARPEAEFLTMARDIALTHHERYDGHGYPSGLAGAEIPLCGRIVALADVTSPT